MAQSPTLKLARPGPLQAVRGGLEAFRKVPGLWRHVLLGVFINYLVFGLFAFVTYYGLYRFAFLPLSESLREFGQLESLWLRFLASIGSALLWLTQAVLLVACVLLALVLALQLIGLWLDGLAIRVVRHVRGSAPPGKSMGLISDARRSLRVGLLHFALGLVSFACAFIPLVGPFLTLAIFAYLLGWEVREPYLLAREDWGDDGAALRHRAMGWTLFLGLLPALLALIPVVGWLLLPAVVVLAATGVAWEGERRRSAT